MTSRIGDAERLERANFTADFLQRRLEDPDQPGSKSEANNHGCDQSDCHFYDGPTQIFEMLEKRFGSFALRQFAKFENVPKRHGNLVRSLLKYSAMPRELALGWIARRERRACPKQPVRSEQRC